MKSFFSRMFSRVAPEVCAVCDGGSGTVFDAVEGTIAQCEACAGSGRSASELGIVAAPVIDIESLRLARSKAQHGSKAA
ncbi:hypothetical protein AYO38_07830 [bacterium SCGC AG-212-C10]|nr:hypothetical protein AYO38_07830 [bacterium SCGC AG-212-C10]